MKTLFSALLILCFFLIHAQNEETLQKYNLQGKVKTMLTTPKNATTGKAYRSFKKYFNLDGFLIKEELMDAKGVRTQTKTIAYNKSGKEVLNTSKKGYGRTEYMYDSNQRLIEVNYETTKIKYHYLSNGNIEYISTIDLKTNNLKREDIYTYSEDTYTIESKYYDDGIIYHQEFNMFFKDNRIKERRVNTSKTEYFYNSKNQLIEKVYSKDATVKETKRYTYRDDGLLIQKTKIANGKTGSYYLEYDHLGNLTKKITTRETESYTYQYDKHNNWLKRSKYKDGQLKIITVRQIEYYENDAKPIPYALADIKPTIGNCPNKNNALCLKSAIENRIIKSLDRKKFNDYEIGTSSKRLLIQFTITKQGKIEGITIKSANVILKTNVETILQNINDIVPGQKNGQNVDVLFMNPVFLKK
jgi:hypothetical protein